MTPEEQAAQQAEAEVKAKTEADEAAKKKDEKRFSQAELDAIIQERLERAKKAGESEAAKIAKKAEEEALAKNQEWQKLAETRQAEIDEHVKRITELEPFKTKAERHEQALANMVKGMTEKLPESIKALLATKDPVEQLEYLNKYGASLGVKSGVPATPSADEGSLTDAEKKNRRDEYARQVRQYKP